VEAVLKLPEDSEERLTELELRGQLVRYLLVEKVVRAIFTVAVAVAVATTAVAVAALTPIALAMMLDPVAVGLLSLIRFTHQILRISRV
jgi:hypothetical protein